MTTLLKDLQDARERAEDMREEYWIKLCETIAPHVQGLDYHQIMRLAQIYARHSADAARWHERISTLLELGKAK